MPTLAIVNSVALNIGLCMYLFELVFLFLLDVYSEMELVDHMSVKMS